MRWGYLALLGVFFSCGLRHSDPPRSMLLLFWFACGRVRGGSRWSVVVSVMIYSHMGTMGALCFVNNCRWKKDGPRNDMLRCYFQPVFFGLAELIEYQAKPKTTCAEGSTFQAD